MTAIRVVPATPTQAAALAPRLRRADADEVWAAARLTPEEAPRQSLALSLRAWAGLADDEVMCLFGLAPLSLLTGWGAPWLLGADGLERHANAFLRRNRAMVADMRALCPRLENRVDARNAVSIRWLRWLGFTLHPATPWGPDGLPFHRFTMGF